MHRSRRVLLLVLLAATAAAARAQPITVIELRHRSAEELLPLLQSLVEPGGALSGRGSQLFARVSPANLEQLRALLAALDRPPRMLEITVRQDLAGEREQRTLRAEGGVVLDSRGAAAGVVVQPHGERVVGTRRAEQRIRVLEGGRALIAIGVAIPFTFNHWLLTPQGLTEVQATSFYEAVTGFAVRPLLAGDIVTLELEPTDVALGPRGLEQTRLMTRVQGRLGEWIALGGADLEAQARAGALGAARANVRRGVWVRVEKAGAR
jgi:hypothetical protein